MARRFGAIRRLRSGNYQASYVSPGGARVTAPITFVKADHAETWLAAQRVDIVRETWRAPSVGSGTLANYAMPWLAQRTLLKPRTVDLYQRLLALHILPALGQTQLKSLTPPVVRAWHSELGQSTGPTAQAQSYRLLRTILNQAVRDGELASNPCQIVGAGTPKTKERQAPTLAQVHELSELVPARYRALVLVAAYSGLRFGELTALTRADVTLEKSQPPAVRVSRAMNRLDGKWLLGTPKSQAGLRTVALPDYLRPVLVEHMDRYVLPGAGALVFATKSGRPLYNANWCSTFARAKRQIGLDDCHFHDLRHAAATLAAQSGATLKDSMARLGHSTPRAALIYMHSDTTRDAMIAQALDQAADAVLEGKVVPLKPRRPGKDGLAAQA